MRADLFLGVAGLLLRCPRNLRSPVASLLSVCFAHELSLLSLSVKLTVLVIDLRTRVDPREALRLCIRDLLIGRRGRGCFGGSLARPALPALESQSVPGE